jgi:hypothetical protein
MKAGFLAIAVFASVLAGGGGGYVAARFTGDNNQSSAKEVAATPLTLDGGETDADNAELVDKLRSEVQALQVRLGQAEHDKTELDKKVESVNAKIDKAPRAPADDPTLNNSGNAIDLDTPEGREVIAKLVEGQLAKRDEERAQQRGDEVKKRMQEFAAMRNKQILDKLASELSLTEVQKTNIDAVLANMSSKFAENMERGRAARESGEDFDWQAEMKKINDDAVAAVKDELSSAQANTLDTMLGEDGNLNSLVGGIGGGGFPPPPPGGGGFPG